MRKSVFKLLICFFICFLSAERCFADRYERMWKEVASLAANDFPESAAEKAEAIRQLALKRGDRLQETAAFLAASGFRQRIMPDSFFIYLPEFQKRMEKTSDSCEKAIYASIISEICIDNAYRTGWNFVDTPGSVEVEFWTHSDFQNAAIEYSMMALAEPEQLAKASLRSYYPLVIFEKNASLRKDDLLFLIGRRTMELLQRSGASADTINSVSHQLLQYYRGANRPDEVILLTLDSVRFTQSNFYRYTPVKNQDSVLLQSPRYKVYEQLLNTYPESQMLAEVYYEVAQMGFSDSFRYQLLQKALSLYRDYPRVSAIENEIKEMERPLLDLSVPACYTPAASVLWPYQYRQMDKMSISVYPLSDSIGTDVRIAEDEAYFKKLRETVPPDTVMSFSFPKQKIAYQMVPDTLKWKTPEQAGNYVVFLESHPVSGESLTQIHTFRVTGVKLLALAHPGSGHIDVWTLDAATGKPKAGVPVFLNLNQGDKEEQKAVSDTTGRCTFVVSRQGSYQLYAMDGEDRSEAVYVYSGMYKPYATDSLPIFQIYSSRPVYRPGDWVELAGVAYRKNGKRYEPVSDYETVLELRDVMGNLLKSDTLITDYMGGWTGKFRLPAEDLNGRFRVSIGRSSISIPVEEYKKTGYNLTAEMERLHWNWSDTLQLRGRLYHLSGSPVVAEKVFLQGNIYEQGTYNQENQKQINDTLQTDAQGNFTCSLPLASLKKKGTASANFLLHAVLPSGERVQSNLFAMVYDSCYHLQLQVEPTVSKTENNPWKFVFLNEKMDSVPATVFYSLIPDVSGIRTPKSSFEGKYVANKDFVPSILSQLPSGAYWLKAQVCMANDTVAQQKRLLVYSPEDTRLPVDTAFWCRPLNTDISEERPFTCLVGSSLKDVSLIYTLSDEKEIRMCRQIQLSDSLLQLSIPYDSAYGKEVAVHLAFVKENEIYQQRIDARYKEEEKQLSYRWIRFRDKITPGQKEEWTLQFLNHEGMPADVRCIATLYDAALDRLATQYWRLDLPDLGRLPYFNWIQSYDGWLRAYMQGLSNQKTVPEYSWGVFDRKYWENWSMYYRYMITGAGRSAVMMEKKAPANAPMEFQEEESSVAADTDMVKDEIQELDESVLRKNLSETAFFIGKAQSDKEGKVSFSFQVPEALTSWHFKALAYTEDMSYVLADSSATTSKSFMARLHLPAFLREEDEADIRVSLDNFSDRLQSGTLIFQVKDAQSDSLLYQAKQMFKQQTHSNGTYIFRYKAQKGVQEVKCAVWAEGEKETDGESHLLRILPQRVDLTVSVPFVTLRGTNQVPLALTDSANRRVPHSWDLSYCFNPYFVAVQALPEMCQADSSQPVQLASASYAAARLKRLCRENSGFTGLLNQIQGKQKENDWVLNRPVNTEEPLVQSAEPKDFLEQLQKLQLSNGAFSWRAGMFPSEQITLRVLDILSGLSGDADDEALASLIRQMENRAMAYVKSEFLKRHQLQEAEKRSFWGWNDWDYLYLVGKKLGADEAEQIPFVKSALQALQKDYPGLDLVQKIRAAQIFAIYGCDSEKEACIRTLKEYLTVNAQKGTFYDQNTRYDRLSDRPLQMHIAALGLMRRYASDNLELIQGMEQWLVLQKRVQGWDNPYISVCAVSCLLENSGSENQKLQDMMTDSLRLMNKAGEEISLQNQEVDSLMTMQHWSGMVDAPDKTPALLTVEKQNPEVGWGAVYAHYNLLPQDIPPSTDKMGYLSISMIPDTATYHIGDEVTTVFKIRVDQDYEQMVVKINTAACLRNVQKQSGYQYLDHIPYYLNLKDTGMELYFDRLPKGNYLLPVRYAVIASGNFLHGGAELSSSYAPEFKTYMPGEWIQIMSK